MTRLRIAFWILIAATLVVFFFPEFFFDRRSTPEYPNEGERTAATLVAYYECNRCHGGDGRLLSPSLEKGCVFCHQEIMKGRLDEKYGAEKAAKWRSTIVHYTAVPTFVSIQKRLRRDWFVAFLRSPFVVRPHLGSMMPKMPISARDADLIANYFFGPAQAISETLTPTQSDLSHGRQLMENLRCGGCHEFTGIEPELPKLLDAVASRNNQGPKLAPDLRFTRDRMTREQIISWLKDPYAINPHTPMPEYSLSDSDRADIVDYILNTPLKLPAPVPLPPAPKPLTRPVSYEEVQARVFRKMCWHCHEDSVPLGGDGGPGNTGGFGYKGESLDLGTYAGVMAGAVNEEGKRISILENDSSGMPLAVHYMMARRAELAGQDDPKTLGMPLGLPAFSDEDIQLVLTWISQGATPPVSEEGGDAMFSNSR